MKSCTFITFSIIGNDTDIFRIELNVIILLIEMYVSSVITDIIKKLFLYLLSIIALPRRSSVFEIRWLETEKAHRISFSLQQMILYHHLQKHKL